MIAHHESAPPKGCAYVDFVHDAYRVKTPSKNLLGSNPPGNSRRSCNVVAAAAADALDALRAEASEEAEDSDALEADDSDERLFWPWELPELWLKDDADSDDALSELAELFELKELWDICDDADDRLLWLWELVELWEDPDDAPSDTLLMPDETDPFGELTAELALEEPPASPARNEVTAALMQPRSWMCAAPGSCAPPRRKVRMQLFKRVWNSDAPVSADAKAT
jgi:hypothetical protein